MMEHHWIAFFQAVGIIGAMHVNPLHCTSQEDVRHFWLNYRAYITWMEGTPRMPQHLAYFFQIIGVIGLLQVNPLRIDSLEDERNFWNARAIYVAWEEAQ